MNSNMKRVDEQELESLQELALLLEQRTLLLGQLHFEKVLLEEHISEEERNLLSLKDQERRLHIRLQKKYGTQFTVDLETGEIQISA